MDFELSDRAKDYRDRLQAFIDEQVHPAESVYVEQVRAADTPHVHPPIMEELKEEARRRGLWNLFLPDEEHGAGLDERRVRAARRDPGPHASSARRRATARRRTPATWRCCTSSAPTSRRSAGCAPLLDGEIRSGFAMTEPDVASSDATNIALRIERDGDDYVLNGRKWWTTGRHAPALQDPDRDGQDGAGGARLRAAVDGARPARHARASRSCARCPSSATWTPRATASCASTDVRVPQSNLIAGEGAGFVIAQARLGPGRIHHCMRAIGAAERALELMCKRADERETFGKPVADALEHPRLDRRGAHRARDGCGCSC